MMKHALPIRKRPPSTTSMKALAMLMAALMSAPLLLRGQLVNDGATNTLNNVTNTFPGDVTVGTNGSFSALVLTNNTLLTNQAHGVIGRNAGANSNAVSIPSPGARWLMSSNLMVGNSGSFNRLLISGVVSNYGGHLGFSFNSNTNTALVTGPGALWSSASNLYVGVFGVGNRLVVTNGGLVQSRVGYVGYDPGSSNNVAIVTGTNSLWSSLFGLSVGEVGAGNLLIITNGGTVENTNGLIGAGTGGNFNAAVVTGPGSLWNNIGSCFVGYSGSSCRLLVSNGGKVQCNNAHVGLVTSNNVAIVTGADSLWTNSASLVVGNLGGGNQLVVSNGGTVFAVSVFVGLETNAPRNRMVVEGGTVHATNATGTGMFDIRQGTNVFNSGWIDVNRLILTNATGAFEFNGGTLSTGRTTNNNGRVFTAGNGTNVATLELRGGTHFFGNGLVVSSNASLIGTGTIVGVVTVQSGGALVPGASVGTLSLSNSPLLQGRTIMEIHKSGLLLTNDQILVAGPVSYGGSLLVSNIGPATLAAGDRFRLFSGASYANTFTTIALPSLDNGLAWTNKLLLDGSIEVVTVPLPRFAGIKFSGTNLIVTGTNGLSNAAYAVLSATNVAAPLTNWTVLVTNTFDSAGAFSFPIAIDPRTPQRYFQLRSP